MNSGQVRGSLICTTRPFGEELLKEPFSGPVQKHDVHVPAQAPCQLLRVFIFPASGSRERVEGQQHVQVQIAFRSLSALGQGATNADDLAARREKDVLRCLSMQ